MLIRGSEREAKRESPQKKRLRRPFSLGVSVGKSLDGDTIRRAAERNPEGFFETVQEMIDEGGLRWSDIKNLRGLWHTLADIEVPATIPVMGETRAIMSGAFPLLTGALSVASINDAYEAVETIGGDLVEEIEDPKRFTEIAGVHISDPGGDYVRKEGDKFPELGAFEERFSIFNRPQGYKISITAETIERNDVSDITSRLNQLGEIAAEDIEEQTLRRVTDHDGSASSGAEPYVLHIDKTAHALYATDNNAPISRLPSAADSLTGNAGNRLQNNGLVDSSDLDLAREQLASMKNSRGKKISIPMSQMILLVPESLAATALKILNSELEPGVRNEVNNWGPRGPYQPMFRSTPKMDDLSTSAWYLGAFRKQFVRKWSLRMEIVSMIGSDTQAFLDRRIGAQYRVGWDVEVGARDYVYVIQNLQGTTAPKDE